MFESKILITEEYLKLYSPIPNNYNWDDIKPFIPIAQEIWVSDILGRPLYNELLEQVSNNEVSGENATLLLKLYPYLSIAIVYESLPFIANHISEKGITKNSSDNSEPISNTELTNIQNHLRTQLEFLKMNFKKWLNEHAECYVLYNIDNCNSNCNIDDCDAFALFQWNTNILNISDKKYLNKYYKMKNKPNSNNRLFSSNNNILMS